VTTATCTSTHEQPTGFQHIGSSSNQLPTLKAHGQRAYNTRPFSNQRPSGTNKFPAHLLSATVDLPTALTSTIKALPTHARFRTKWPIWFPTTKSRWSWSVQHLRCNCKHANRRSLTTPSRNSKQQASNVTSTQQVVPCHQITTNTGKQLQTNKQTVRDNTYLQTPSNISSNDVIVKATTNIARKFNQLTTKHSENLIRPETTINTSAGTSMSLQAQTY
jgi:hypothetical protein